MYNSARLKGDTAALLTLVTLCLSIAPGAVSATPWRLSQAADLPSWLSISGTQRTRYENLDNRYRLGRQGSDQMLALRTIIKTEARSENLSAALEFIDSRAYLDDAGTAITTTMVNPAELLQGYIALTNREVFRSGDESTIRAGRLTLDVGSRRYVARSKYRNTINTFTGIEWNWSDPDGNHIQAFYTLPVNRKPNLPQALRDNDIEFDEEDMDVRFWGLYYGTRGLPWGLEGEIFLFGLDEDDVKGRPSRNRNFLMPGFRLYQPKAPAKFDWLLESAFQIGESRATALPTDQRDLDTFAYNARVELGYSWDHASKPRLNAEFDIASGDDDPFDGDYGRFDTLFGARRLDFGPTGIYGAFARSNIISPGLRLNMKPTARSELMLCYRGFWLESSRDAWTTSRLRDPSGNSGRFIAQQIEGRLRYTVLPESIALEFGFAAAFDGGFMQRAPLSPGNQDMLYTYSHIMFTF